MSDLHYVESLKREEPGYEKLYPALYSLFKKVVIVLVIINILGSLLFVVGWIFYQVLSLVL